MPHDPEHAITLGATSDATDGRDRPRDEGTVLILTLLLTIVLAAVVLALATYAAAGVRTSRVTTERTESNAAATAALTWTIEEFAKKQLAPEDPAVCGASPVAVAVPVALVGDASVEVSCTNDALSAGTHPQVRLDAEAVTADGMRRSIEVLLEVPATEYATQINTWIVD